GVPARAGVRPVAGRELHGRPGRWRTSQRSTDRGLRYGDAGARARRHGIPLRPAAARTVLSRVLGGGHGAGPGRTARWLGRARPVLRGVRPPRRLLGVEAATLGHRRGTADRRGSGGASDRLLGPSPPAGGRPDGSLERAPA